MKLELKHLAPYLPYNLKGIGFVSPSNSKDGKQHFLDRKLISIHEPKSQLKMIHISNVDGEIFKPILRPLSDLMREITNSNNETFVFIDTLEIGEEDNGTEYDHGNIKTIAQLEYIAKNNEFLDIHYLPYSLVQDLIKNHFDILGLIEKGLAIDINTLEK